MKKIVLVGTFCDNQEKLEYLSKNLKIIKSLGLDSMIITPIELPFDVIKLADYCIVTKDNPVLEWPKKAMSQWVSFYSSVGNVVLSRTFNDYGFAGLWQVKKLSDYTLSFDYDMFYHIIYDTVIDQTVIDCFLSTDKSASIYPSKRRDAMWKVGLHLMAFNRENMKKFADLVSIDNYLSETVKNDGDAFTWLENCPVKIIPCTVEKDPVEDSIFLYGDWQPFDYSPSPDFKLFIQKCNYYAMDVRALLYNVSKKPLPIKILTNLTTTSVSIEEDSAVIDLVQGQYCEQVNQFIVEYNNESFNLSDIFKKIGFNSIVINGKS